MIEIFKMHPELQKLKNNEQKNNFFFFFDKYEQKEQFSRSKSNISLAFRMMFKAYN